MDLSFAVQARALRYMAEQGKGMKPGVYTAPPEIDSDVAALKLRSLGITTDILTDEQKEYTESF
jgi:adenosylhomocysteinase